MYTVDFLRSRRVWFEELLHSPASSSTKRAHSVHVPGCRVAKTVLVKAGDRFVLAVLPSTCRVDLGRLGEMLGLSATDVRLATTDELIGHLHRLRARGRPAVRTPLRHRHGLRFEPGRGGRAGLRRQHAA